MMFEDLVRRTASWLDGSGYRSRLVVSSRVRLARNLPLARFTARASSAERQRVIEAVLGACRAGSLAGRLTFFDAGDLSEAQRGLLVERHLISPALAKGEGPRGVLVDAEEVASVMVNEEDHLRIQAMQSGFQPYEAWEIARRLAQALEADLTFSRSEKWGYLTACPTNTGTGLRASTLIHMPGLVLTQEMDGVMRGVAQMGFTVRGLYGEGTDVSGNLFQVSNQITLGRTDLEILEALDRVVKQLVESEDRAREALLEDIRPQIEDKIWRAYGLLSQARLLTSQEFMNLSSALRLGIGLGIFQQIDVGTLNELMVKTKPFHLQCLVGRQLEASERDRVRAEMTRRRMAELGTS